MILLSLTIVAMTLLGWLYGAPWWWPLFSAAFSFCLLLSIAHAIKNETASP